MNCPSGRMWYSVYVLLILMIAYLTNQTDRFVLGIASDKISSDLGFGAQECFPNLSWVGSINNGSEKSHCSDHCSEHQHNQTHCDLFEECNWQYSSIGIRYQVLAGPAFIVVFALSSLPMGILASIPSVRRTLVLAVCVFMWSAMTLLSGFVKEYWQLLLTRIGLGVFQSACIPFATSLVSDYFKPEHRGMALGLFSLGVYIGYSLAFAFNFIVESEGWRWAFRIASFPGFVLSLLLFTVKEPDRRSSHETMEIRRERKYSKNSSLLKRVIISYLQLPLLLLCIGAGLRQGGGVVWAYNAKSYFRLLHCDVHGVGIYLSWVPVVGGSVGVVLGGWISDKLAKRWGNKARIIVLVSSTLLSSPFLFGTLYLKPPWAFLFLLVAYVVGEMWFGVCIAVAMDLVPLDIVSTAVAMYNFIVNNIGGNLNLLLPLLQKVVGLQTAMILLFPGTYILAGMIFIATGLSWRCRCVQLEDIKITAEVEGLLQPPDEDLSTMLTESQEIQRRLSKRYAYNGVDSSVSSSDSKHSIVLTASI